jgi:hypothetical protein
MKRYGEKRTFLKQIPAMTDFVKITGQIKKAAALAAGTPRNPVERDKREPGRDDVI